VPVRLHLSPSGRALQHALAGVLAVPLADPFQAEVVAVPAKGVERWLSQELSTSLGAGVSADGVCANVVFPSPARVLDDAVSAVFAPIAASVDAWRPEATTWHLVELLRELPAEADFEPLRQYLSRGRLYATASKLATLFARYDNDRPDGVDFPADLAWQQSLRTSLEARIGLPRPAVLHAEALAALRSSPDAVPLPARLSVYGLSRISRARLDVLVALAEHREVHLFVHHPGRALWDAVGEPALLRADDRSAEKLRNPLLVSLGRDVRELQQRLRTAAPDLEVAFHEADLNDSLLGRLQRSLVTDTVASAPLAPGDVSVQVHACHGQARQVEVLREAVLGVLAADPSLQPRDVLVMCPDVEAYAPLLKAVFETTDLRVSIADRSPRQTNPMLGLAARLIELAGSRMTGAQVLDLAGASAVRRRFGFADDDIEQLRGWTVDAHVHWGLDADHRDGWGLGGLPDGTWRQGLDRLLAGVALGGSDKPFAGLLATPGIDSTDIDLVGRMAEVLTCIESALASLTAAGTIEQWLTALDTAVRRLGDVPPFGGEWQLVQLERELADVRDSAASATASLSLTDVQVLLADRLAGRPTRTSFRTGGMTVCTLTPMRSVPHKVICLLGMDDAAFPRHGIPDGDDVLARAPRLGERDPRSEDRQLFLDAVLAAGTRLVITYNGADVRSGGPLPPAVPVGELLDALEALSPGAKEAVTVRHPLQPFDPRNFLAGSELSFDKADFAGAVALTNDAESPWQLAPEVLPAPAAEEDTVPLRGVIDLLQHPAKAFLRQRLDVFGSSRDDEPSDAIPLTLNALEKWAVGDRTLQARLLGRLWTDLAECERARGDLPPLTLGDALLRELQPPVDQLASEAATWLTPERTAQDIDLVLPDGRRLSGVVGGLHGDVLVTVTFSKIKAKQRIRAWVELLALTASDPGREWTSVLIGRSPVKGRTVARYTLPRLSPVEAPLALALLVAVRDLGLRTPLPLPVDCCAAYAGERRSGGLDRAFFEAAKPWTSGYNFSGDDVDPDNVLCWGGQQPFSVLREWTTHLPLPGAGYDSEGSAFGTLTRRIWADLVEHEVVKHT
jgi:exodeoxyribonuclease V gamma subunit